MFLMRSIPAALLGLSLLGAPLIVQAQATNEVRPEWIMDHEYVLAGPALRGRKSASPDEAIAAAYVAGQFQSFGLTTAPTMTDYVQTAQVKIPKPDGVARLSIGGVSLKQGEDFQLIYSNVTSIEGAVVYVSDADKAAPPKADVWVIDKASKQSLSAWARLGAANGVKAVIVAETKELKAFTAAPDFETRISVRLVDEPQGALRPDMIVLKADAFDRVVASKGPKATLTVTDLSKGNAFTTNAIGYIKGSDPKAGTILITAHLDHLGVKRIGTQDVTYYGANDDASGVVAVLELARVMAAGPQPKRSILFVCYGSEELGLLGSTYFAAHPPVPLSDIIANLEIEMIGQQDPKLPEGIMMMTGFDRSDFGPTMQSKGAKITADPYPDQHFFERSDNYALALEGIVAHTISGWAVTPTYHTPDDDIAHLNIDFMAGAIGSLIEPLRYLANSDYVPSWKEGGKPKK